MGQTPGNNQSPVGTVSMSDMLTTLKNVVIALNSWTAAYLSVQGTSTEEAITAPEVVKVTSGRICSIVVLVAGTTPGSIYDSNQTTALTELLYTIPNTVSTSPTVLNLPTDIGILIVPGTGQSVTVNWS